MKIRYTYAASKLEFMVPNSISVSRNKYASKKASRQKLLLALVGVLKDKPKQRVLRGVFDLSAKDEGWCWEHLRFRKEDIPILAVKLQVPDPFKTKRGDSCGAVEALCMLLCKLSRPRALLDL